MAQVDKRIPLVVFCCISAEPWGNRFLLRVVPRFCSFRETSGCEFHIIYPILFGIDIWRSDGYRLCYTRLTFRISIGAICLRLQQGMKAAVIVIDGSGKRE